MHKHLHILKDIAPKIIFSCGIAIYLSMKALSKGSSGILLAVVAKVPKATVLALTESDNLNAIMSLPNNITTCMAFTTCNSANNHHFLHRESLFQSVRQGLCF